MSVLRIGPGVGTLVYPARVVSVTAVGYRLGSFLPTIKGEKMQDKCILRLDDGIESPYKIVPDIFVLFL